jgi:L-asparaginase II
MRLRLGSAAVIADGIPASRVCRPRDYRRGFSHLPLPRTGTLTRVAIPESVDPLAAGLANAPVLAHVNRCGMVESVHRGLVVVTAPDGSVAQAWGEPSTVIYPRSANKPLQAAGMVAAGLRLPARQLALACASHNGEDFHLQAARDILTNAGLSEADLDNTPDYPVDEAARVAWIRAGHGPASITQNCSGKHAAMLATCVVRSWDRAGYLAVDHPLQQAITDVFTEITGAAPAVMAVDGCGAPLHGIPLVSLAAAFGRMAAAAPDTPEGIVADAIRAEPDYLGGTGRGVTELVRAVPGLVAKDGAESVYAVGLPDGRGIAVKVVDGHSRAKSVLLAAALRQLGVGDEKLWGSLEFAPILAHGRPVGAVVAVGFDGP